MNLGLGNLTELKRELLLAADAAGTDNDTAVAALGLGMARRFESFCGRRFERVVDDTVEFPADLDAYIVPRYPLEEVSEIAVRENVAQGWVVQSSSHNFNRLSGQVFLEGPLSGGWAQTRLTYTGGYFFETLEPDDDNYPTEQPAGSEPLPLDLKLAWFLQCKFLWDRRSLVEKAKAGFKDGEGFTGADTKLLPEVEATLNSYRRMQLL